MYFPFRARPPIFQRQAVSLQGVQHAMKKRLLEIYNKYISWVGMAPSQDASDHQDYILHF